MGNPVFKFTLSQTKPRTLRQVYPLSGWTNEGIALQTDWTTGEFPFVTLVDGGTADRLRNTTISGVTAGDHVLSYSITSTKTAFHVARIRFEKAGVDVSQMLPDTHGLDPIEIPLVNGTTVGTVNIRLSDIPDEVLITVVDPGGGGGSTTTVNYLDMELTDGTESTVISEPDGWKDAKLKMIRDSEFHSLIEYFEGSFIFYGENNVDNGGADFIKVAEQQYGPSAKIDILIEADIDGDGTYEETIFNGQLDLTGLKEVFDNKIQVPIIRNDLWANFMARKDVAVDMRSTTDVDGNVVDVPEIVDINLTSQVIKKQFDGYLNETRTFSQEELTTSDYIQFDVDVYTLDEIETKYPFPIINNAEIPQAVIDVEEDGQYTFDLRIEASVAYYEITGGSTSPGCVITFDAIGAGAYMNVYIQINDETPVQFTETSSSLILSYISTIYTYQATRTLKKGDQITIYGDIVADIADVGEYSHLWIHSKKGIATILEPTLFINPDPPNTCFTIVGTGTDVNVSFPAPSGEELPTRFIIEAHTTYPNTTAQGFLIHDAAAAIIARIVGFQDRFRSEYIGSTQTLAHQYDADGCAWKNVILQGLQIRGYDIGDKQFSLSFNKLWDCISPLLFLGLTYDNFDGTESIIIDSIDAFFDASAVSVNLSNVREISREYDASLLYNQVETGFSKWQSENIQGIDDPQTKRKWVFSPRNFDKALSILSEAITAGVAIEATRRKTIEKSEDYKYDNEPFIIAINGTGVSPDRYLPELDENFNSITGLEDSDKRYNTIHTPLRMLLRWAKWWNGCLQKYQNSIVKFISGEGNYDMVTDYSCSGGDPCLAVICDPVSESANINLATYGQGLGYLHLPQLYKIEVINFTWDQYLAIRNNRHLAIGISQTLSNYKRFFIKELTYEVCKGKCSIVAWPYDESPIEVVETTMPETPAEETEAFDEDYQAILDYATGQGYTLPSGAQQILQNQLVLDLKAAGIWSSLDLLYIFATDAGASFARINWISPGTFSAVDGSAGPTFTADAGFQGNESTQYLTTGWDPATNAVNFTLNDASAFVYSNTNVGSAATRFLFGSRNAANTGRVEIVPKNVSSQHVVGLNSAATTPGLGTAPVSSQGFFMGRRTASNDLRLFKDGSQVGATQTLAATDSLNNDDVAILASNGNGTVSGHSAEQVSMFGLGASLSGKESDLYTAWLTYFSSL